MADLDLLLRRYRPTVLRYLACRFLLKPEDAEDLWHGFVTSRILEGGLLTRADPKRGRLRNLMLRALDHYAIAQLRWERSRKRSPADEMLSLDDLPEHELAANVVVGEDETELVWARAVLAGALLNMRIECEQQGYGDVWTVFQERVLQPIIEDADPLEYDLLVHRCHFESAAKACNALNTAKRMFKRHVNKVIEEYAGDDAEAAAELRVMQQQLDTWA